MKQLFYCILCFCFQFFVLMTELHAQKVGQSDENQQPGSTLSISELEDGDLRLEFTARQTGEFRIELVNPMGIKSGVFLLNKKIEAGEKKSWTLDQKSLRAPGNYYVLVYRDGFLDHTRLHHVPPKMKKKE